MAITKITYVGASYSYLGKVYTNKKKTMDEIFGGKEAFESLGVITLTSFFRKINSFLKIKRWGCDIGGSERYFVTIILPLVLIVFNLEFAAIIFSYVLLSFFSIFFIIRIKNLLGSYL
jgi:hypothetical protein